MCVSVVDVALETVPEWMLQLDIPQLFNIYHEKCFLWAFFVDLDR